MITLVQAKNYRSLRYISQPLKQFLVLVGPNASGKTSFLDIIAFLSDLLREGPSAAVRARSEDVRDLTWNREHDAFQLAIHLQIPENIRKRFTNGAYTECRYEVEVGLDRDTRDVRVLGEQFWLIKTEPKPDVPQQRSVFPSALQPPPTILQGGRTKPGWRKVLNKVGESGNDYFRSETGNWNNLFRLGPQKAALANLPEDQDKFPVASWAKRWIMEGVQTLILNSQAMRRPASPRSPLTYQPDGSNLAVVLAELKKKNRAAYEQWLEHVRTAIPDLTSIDVEERAEDRHLYIVAKYSNGLKVPSWLISDGTLRLLALTLLAYLPIEGTYLIEEPENGIHPRGVESVFQSLSSVYGAQVLVATHSPVILNLADPDEVLCFAKTQEGVTDIVLGSEHPRLRDWRGEVPLGSLLVAGVLG